MVCGKSLQTSCSRNRGLPSSQHPTQNSNTSPLASGMESSGSPQKAVRVLAFMEALWPTTGPAKNLMEFACRAAVAPKSLLRADIAIATYTRGTGPISRGDSRVNCSAQTRHHSVARSEIALLDSLGRNASGAPLDCISSWLHLDEPKN